MLATSIALALAVQHPAQCAIPARWGVEKPVPGQQQVANRISVSATGGIRWNGSPIDRATLKQYLASADRFVPRPQVVIPAHGTDCGALQSLAAQIEETMACDPAICMVSWDPPPPPPPAPPAPPGPPRRF